MTDSQHNARAQSQATGIPQKRTHAGSGTNLRLGWPLGGVWRRLTWGRTVSSPSPKRKSLVDRAGEPYKPQIPAPGTGLTRAAMGGIKGSSIASLASTNIPLPGPSRQIPASSFAKSVGPASRTAGPTRAPTSMGFTQSTSTRPRGLPHTRPATAMANRKTDPEAGQLSQQKGMEIVPFFQEHPPRKSKSRIPVPQRTQPALQPRQGNRDISGLSRQFQAMSLDDQPSHHDGFSGSQAVSKTTSTTSKQLIPATSQSDVQSGSIALAKVPPDEAARLNPFRPATPQGTLAPPPSTPSQIMFNEALGTVRTLLQSPLKQHSLPTKSSSPKNLSKHSNLTSFTGWDVDGRLNEFESQFKVMKEAFEGTVTDRKAMEAAIDLAKNRGRCPQVVVGTLNGALTAV